MHPRERKLRADLVRDPGEDRDFQQRLLFCLRRDEFNGLEIRHRMKRLQSLALRARKPIVVNVDHPAEGQRRIVD